MLFMEGKAGEALKVYEDKGAITTTNTKAGAILALCRDFTNDPADLADKIAIASTNAEARAINEQIRQTLQDRGIVAQGGAMFENADGDRVQMATGDRVLFRKNLKAQGFKNGQRGTVQETQQKPDGSAILTVKMDDGRLEKFSTRDNPHLALAYCGTTHKAQGATVKSAFFLFNPRMGDLSTAYVGMTRHKGSARLYSTAADRPKMAEKMSTAHFKGTTLDLQPEAQTAPSLATSGKEHGGQLSAQMPQNAPKTAQATPTAPTQAQPTAAPATGAGAGAGDAAGSALGAAAAALIKAAQEGAQRAKEAAEISGHFARQQQAHNEKVHEELAGMNGGKQKQPELEFE
ncbi:MAG: hypothetical protein LBE50_01430 [Gallionellaceae bacterium]|jgi:hypothetical protein|nr:hypothetical protein [Gallionellaceae bacterium]